MMINNFFIFGNEYIDYLANEKNTRQLVWYEKLYIWYYNNFEYIIIIIGFAFLGFIFYNDYYVKHTTSYKLQSGGGTPEAPNDPEPKVASVVATEAVPGAASSGASGAAAEVAGKTGTAEVAGKTGTAEVAGKTGTTEVAGKTGTTEVAGKTGTTEVAGKTGTTEVAGKTVTTEVAGVAGAAAVERQGGQENNKEQGGKSEPKKKGILGKTKSGLVSATKSAARSTSKGAKFGKASYGKMKSMGSFAGSKITSAGSTLKNTFMSHTGDMYKFFFTVFLTFAIGVFILPTLVLAMLGFLTFLITKKHLTKLFTM